MLKRKLFFWLERLKINRAERRAVIILMIILLGLFLVNALLKPKPPFEQSYYSAIEKVFNRRTALLQQKNKKILAAYKGIPASAVKLDTLPDAADQKSAQTININTASAELLTKLPGIGPVYAQHIVDYRNANGPFTVKAELLKVEGIGDVRLNKIKSLIVLGKNIEKSKMAATGADTLHKATALAHAKSEGRVEAERINVNTADAKALKSLPGIGDVYAQNIIEYRRKNGPFPTFKELLKVKGIGKKRLAKLKPFIKLTGTSE